MGLLSLLKRKPKQKTVVHFPITKIDIKAKDKIEGQLKNVKKSNTAALLLSINTKLPNSS